MDFTQRIMQPVSVTAVNGRPAADHLRLEVVHLMLPSVSCVKELRRNRDARNHQARNEKVVSPVKKFRFRKADFLVRRISSPIVPCPPTWARSKAGFIPRQIRS